MLDDSVWEEQPRGSVPVPAFMKWRAEGKAKIIDGAAGLVAQRIMAPADAVIQLGSVPDRPFDQKQWVMAHLAQIKQAEINVLDHHAAAFAGQNVDTTPPSQEDHMSTISGLLAHYKSRAPQSGGMPQPMRGSLVNG